MSIPSSQGNKLDQYSIAARGQMRVGHKAASWAGFATAAGATLAMSGVAEASIIWSGTQNIPTALVDPVGGSTSQTTAIDLNNDGQNDVVFGLQNRVASAAPDGVQRLGGGGFLSGLGTAVRASFSITATSSNAQQLAAGQLIGPGGTFGGASSAIAQGDFNFALVNGGVATTTTNTQVTGLWGLNVNGFVGVQFQLADGNHYAWIQLNFDDRDGNGRADRLTVVDWAWETDVNTGIEAGNVPEPTPLALLAAGAVGIGTFRRKRKTVARDPVQS